MLFALLFTIASTELQDVARLPGEPSVISAAGLTSDEQPVLTLENRGAFEPVTSIRRVVVEGSAAVDIVRWFKTKAPSRLRQQWLVSALPSREGLDAASLQRWLSFQAADVTIAIDRSDPRPTDTFRAALERAPGAPSADHAAIVTRASREPLAIAKLLAAKYPGTPAISYIPSVAWANTLALAQLTNEPALRERVLAQTRPWRDGQDLFGNRIQLTAVAGTFVFRDLGAPDVVAKGVDAASRVKEGDVYEYGQGWTDDMFMATVVLARNGKADLAARMLVAYASRLQRPDGIFVHATNAPVAWGRGNGFAALGLAEALDALRPDDPSRARVLDSYRRLMTAVKASQAPDGMWNEVVDEPGSYREESATAMLLAAMSRGIRAGWIDRSFLATVERAWRGVAAHVADAGTIIDVCTSTGAGPTKRYYLDRAAVTGADDRGGAMALMAAVEIATLRHPPAFTAK